MRIAWGGAWACAGVAWVFPDEPLENFVPFYIPLQEAVPVTPPEKYKSMVVTPGGTIIRVDGLGKDKPETDPGSGRHARPSARRRRRLARLTGRGRRAALSMTARSMTRSEPFTHRGTCGASDYSKLE